MARTARGVTDYWVETRSPAMNGYAAVQNGDRIVVNLWQAGTGAQTGHAGGTCVTVDNAAFSAGCAAFRGCLGDAGYGGSTSIRL